MRQQLNQSELNMIELVSCMLIQQKNVSKRKINHIAKETGLDRDSVRKIINGETNPSFAALHRVCNALDVRITFTNKKV